VRQPFAAHTIDNFCQGQASDGAEQGWGIVSEVPGVIQGRSGGSGRGGRSGRSSGNSGNNRSDRDSGSVDGDDLLSWLGFLVGGFNGG
jgi:hypothetical protein